VNDAMVNALFDQGRRKELRDAVKRGDANIFQKKAPADESRPLTSDTVEAPQPQASAGPPREGSGINISPRYTEEPVDADGIPMRHFQDSGPRPIQESLKATAALWRAIFSDDYVGAKAAIEAGADVFKPDYFDKIIGGRTDNDICVFDAITPHDLAIKLGHSDIADLLRRHGAKG